MVKQYWFCYERSTVGKWAPVLYHGEKPKENPAGGKEDKPKRTIPVEVSDLLSIFDPDHEIPFGALTEKFPPPEEPND